MESVRAMMFHINVLSDVTSETVAHASEIRNSFMRPVSELKAAYDLLKSTKHV